MGEVFDEPASRGLIAQLERRMAVGRLKRNEPLAAHTTWKVGGPAAVYLEAGDSVELMTGLEAAARGGLPWLLLGAGSNLLVSDEPYPGLVIRLVDGFKEAGVRGEAIEAGAAALLSEVAAIAAEEGLTGLEFGAQIPGTIGGALRINAGAFGGEIGALVEQVVVVDMRSGLPLEMVTNPSFGYRTSSLSDDEIVVSAKLRLRRAAPADVRLRMTEMRERRKMAQPKGRSAGSVFRNPVGVSSRSAGELIDAAGCKGLSVGGARVSELHANFILTERGARAGDVYELMRLVRRKVQEASGVALEPEVKLIGFDAL